MVYNVRRCVWAVGRLGVAACLACVAAAAAVDRQARQSCRVWCGGLALSLTASVATIDRRVSPVGRSVGRWSNSIAASASSSSSSTPAFHCRRRGRHLRPAANPQKFNTTLHLSHAALSHVLRTQHTVGVQHAGLIRAVTDGADTVNPVTTGPCSLLGTATDTHARARLTALCPGLPG